MCQPSVREDKPRAPFPWLPMLALSMCLISHMFVQSSQFAYVGYMVEYLGVVDNKDAVGYYAGLLSSAFMIGRFASSYLWGRCADRYGRLPVMYVGLWSIALLSIAFGLSTTFWWAFVCRLLLGALNGVAAVSKTLVSEVCGKEHEVVGMGVTTTAWSIALVVGPGVGGVLAQPAKSYPETFSESGLFGRYPYLLPNIVGAGFALMALPLVFFFLAETRKFPDGRNGEVDEGNQPLQERENFQGKSWFKSDSEGPVADQVCRGSKNGQKSPVPDGNGELFSLHADASDNDTCDNSEEGSEPESLLADPHVRKILFMNGLYSFVNIGFDEIFPLWTLSTVANGGLDWTTQDIGQVLSLVGAGILVFEMCVKPLFIRRLGVNRSQRWGSTMSVALYLAVPYLNLLGGTGLPLTLASSAILFLAHACANAMYINLALATNNAVCPSRRGELNGLAMTACSLTKAAAPFFCSVIFAWSINHTHPFPLNHHLIYILLALGMLVVAIAGWDTIALGQGKHTFMHSDSVSSEVSDNIEDGQVIPVRAETGKVLEKRGLECKSEKQELLSGGKRTDALSYKTYVHTISSEGSV